MSPLFDTNILIDYLNSREEAKNELSRYDNWSISIITYIEVLTGVVRKNEQQLVRQFLSGFQCYSLDQRTADLSINLRQQHKLKTPDAIIYATALDTGKVLVTRNTKDFKTDWSSIRIPYKLKA